MKRAFLIAVLMMCSTAHADTLGEEDGIVVNRINATDFEVVEDVNFGAAEFWCGAATYVQRRSGMSGQTPIYVKRSRGPSVTQGGQKGVVFTLDPAGLPRNVAAGYTLRVDAPGLMMKSVRARSYCRDAFTRSTK